MLEVISTIIGFAALIAFGIWWNIHEHRRRKSRTPEQRASELEGVECTPGDW